jgi:hypothetical protein
MATEYMKRLGAKSEHSGVGPQYNVVGPGRMYTNTGNGDMFNAEKLICLSMLSGRIIPGVTYACLQPV